MDIITFQAAGKQGSESVERTISWDLIGDGQGTVIVVRQFFQNSTETWQFDEQVYNGGVGTAVGGTPNRYAHTFTDTDTLDGSVRYQMTATNRNDQSDTATSEPVFCFIVE